MIIMPMKSEVSIIVNNMLNPCKVCVKFIGVLLLIFHLTLYVEYVLDLYHNIWYAQVINKLPMGFSLDYPNHHVCVSHCVPFCTISSHSFPQSISDL